ncbi:unnamed protein product [Cyprideis torosa]|uniref:Uncharacterized protein n=1 Tax=Cyprideis torosa TaxID=163714 RepID=A0A7R8WHW6_9CRUS|nr:unnamed protein product [Cyprideis torosa]CAG0898019.1 unnamed protein product [Cyprideis torosa]
MTLVAETGIEDGTIWQPPVGVFARICIDLVRGGRRREKEISPGEEPKPYLEEAVLERRLSNEDLRGMVCLPHGMDRHEWFATHTIAFFECLNVVCGSISETCTPTACPDMTGPSLRQYLWVDDKGKKLRLPAPQYIDLVMTFVQKAINDENLFPTKFGNPFPDSFDSLIRKILRLLYSVLAHLYHEHFKEILLLGLHQHLNSVFIHLILFNQEFKLVEDKEIEVLDDLVEALQLSASSATPPRPSTPNSSCSPDHSTTPPQAAPPPTAHTSSLSPITKQPPASNSSGGLLTSSS